MNATLLLTVLLQAVTVTFSTTDKPASWSEMKATAGDTLITSGAAVPSGSTVVFSAVQGIGHHVEWWVNGEQQTATDSELALTVTANTQVEARYKEHFKCIFEGTPFVQDNFARTLSQWTDAQTIFRFGKHNDVYCFRRAVAGNYLPEEEIYLRWWNAYADVEAYYFDERDIPELIPYVLRLAGQQIA